MPEVKQAAHIFKSEIFPYVWIFTSKKFVINLIPRKHHFKHLTGVQYSSNGMLKKLKSEFFYSKALKGEIKTKDIAEFENKDEVVVNTWIENRLKNFCEIPSLLSDCKEIILYNKQFNRSLLDVDYLFFRIDSSNGLYLGIRENDCGEYDLVSFFCETENPQKHKKSQKCFQIESVKKLSRSDFKVMRNY